MTEADGTEGESPAVTAHESQPGRTVLVEEGNADAWIASDVVVEPEL